MTWTTDIISTTASIARHLYKINLLVPISQSWLPLITIAHLKLGNDIIARNNYYLQTLDNILNPTTLGLALDYLSLALIYTNLSNNGLYLQFNDKKQWYFHLYNTLISQAIPRIKVYGYQPYTVAGMFAL